VPSFFQKMSKSGQISVPLHFLPPFWRPSPPFHSCPDVNLTWLSTSQVLDLTSSWSSWRQVLDSQAHLTLFHLTWLYKRSSQENFWDECQVK
jgi:hypothetical protein